MVVVVVVFRTVANIVNFAETPIKHGNGGTHRHTYRMEICECRCVKICVRMHAMEWNCLKLSSWISTFMCQTNTQTRALMCCFVCLIPKNRLEIVGKYCTWFLSFYSLDLISIRINFPVIWWHNTVCVFVCASVKWYSRSLSFFLFLSQNSHIHIHIYWINAWASI